MAYTTVDDGSEYFQATIYTGNASDGLAITNSGNSNLQPDWLWIKKRSGSGQHVFVDSTRGVNKQLFSSLTDAEQTSTKFVASLDSDGFTLNDSSSGTGDTNTTNGGTYVAWQWKANGGTTTTNDASATSVGTIDSVYQANTTAGFSIVTYTGTGSEGTIAHGLGATPKMIIWKRRDSSANWSVQGTQSGIDTDRVELVLNSNGAVSSADSRIGRQSQWSSTVFEVNNYTDQNADGGTYVAYCFAEKQGYSKFGSYTANGNVDGPFVYTGFRPAWVMFKQTNSNDTAHWFIYDSTRSPTNVIGDVGLAANLSTEEGLGSTWNPNTSDSVVDFVSNGFKIRTTATSGFNISGNTMIYMAFAEHPFVSSKGVPVTAR